MSFLICENSSCWQHGTERMTLLRHLTAFMSAKSVRGIACVERYHHVGAVAFIIGDIAGEKSQVIETELFCSFVAKCDNVLLQIEAGDLDVALLNDPQIMVESKGEIALAAAEIYDAQRPCLRKMLEAVFRDLEEPVYLSEFGIVLLCTLPSGDITPSSIRKLHGTPSAIMYFFLLSCESSAAL